MAIPRVGGISSEELAKIYAELHSALLSKTTQDVLKCVLNCKKMGQARGFESYRLLHYSAAPRSIARAEAVRDRLIKAAPAKGPLELRLALLALEGGIQEYDDAAPTPMGDDVKVIALKAVLTQEIRDAFLRESPPHESYLGIKAWVEAYVAHDPKMISGIL